MIGECSNHDYCHGYEIQLPRYAEAEHTKNMIFVLVRVDDNENTFASNSDILLVEINALPQKSASKIKTTTEMEK